MTAQLRSPNISLLVDYGPELSVNAVTNLNELWQTLRKTAVEPGQAPPPFLASFADECLFCAHISINGSTPTMGPDHYNATTGVHAAEDERPLSSSTVPAPLDRRVGLVYLHTSPVNLPSEANIGVIVKQDMRHRGYAREAVQLVLGWAFEELKFHRVQAAILETPFRDSALRLFIGSGFTHEGTRRRAVYQPEGDGMAGAWKDVTYLAMLDTEWMLRSMWKRDKRAQERPIVTVWDEMFARHAKEREELLRWEEKHGGMKRTSSTETLKENIRNAAPDLAYLTDDASSVGEPSREGSASSSPRLNVVVSWDTDDDAEMEDNPGLDELRQQWEAVARRRTQYMDGALLQPSSPLDRVLSLPSIPSTRLSEGNLQSPVTIPSSPGSTPPSSPFPSSSTISWMDSDDEDNWLPSRVLPPPAYQIPITPRGSSPRPGPASIRSRSRSNSVSSSASAGSWSDAQSSFGTNSSAWDVISNSSEAHHDSPRVPLETGTRWRRSFQPDHDWP